jgi:hypothetical protein
MKKKCDVCLMVGIPNKQSKTKRLVFIPLGQEEEKISITFKTVCIQDDETQHDMLLEAIQLWFVKHHLDLGGNPQRILPSFQQETLTAEKCQCGREVVVWALNLTSKVEFKFCKQCFGKVPMRYDAKTWHIIRRKSN